MVGHHAYPGMNVSIHVNGAPLQEYYDETLPDDEGTATRYIEAVTGAIFEIHCSSSSNSKQDGHVLGFACYVDGGYAQGKMSNETGRTVVSTGKQVSPQLLKQYRFGRLELTEEVRDDEGKRAGQERCKNIGTIRVAVEEQKKLYTYQENDRNYTEVVDSVHGKDAAQQTLTHFVDFSTPIDHRTGRCWKTQATGKRVDIIFHYRSRSALQILEFIPADPTPSQLLKKPVDQMSQAELKAMQEMCKAMNDKLSGTAATRRSLIADVERPRKKVKVEGVIEIQDDENDPDDAE